MKTVGIVAGLGVVGVAALLWTKIGGAATANAAAAAPTASGPGPADAAYEKAFTLHAIGHGGNNVRAGVGDEGQYWATQARGTPGVTAAQIASLNAMGFT